MPPKGFHGYVKMHVGIIFFNKGKIIERSQIIGHKIQESYERTFNKMIWEEVHKIANETYFGGTYEDPITVRAKKEYILNEEDKK